MNSILEQISEAVTYIKGQYSKTPEIGIVLGSGLGNFVSEMKVEKEIPYHTIPHFPESTVEGHSGKLIFGVLSGKQIVVMAGRIHFYEGYSAQEVVFPIRAMKFLGIHTLLISNAAGGVNPGFKVGDLMIMADHISLACVNPLLGRNESELGPRFPDMSEPYKRALIALAKNIGSKMGYHLKEGVYFGVTGPTFETRAEYKMIHILGADAVGMSTVQEVIAGVHAGLNVFGISVITDLGIREADNIITHEEVLHEASLAEPKLTALLKEMIKAI